MAAAHQLAETLLALAQGFLGLFAADGAREDFREDEDQRGYGFIPLMALAQGLEGDVTHEISPARHGGYQQGALGADPEKRPLLLGVHREILKARKPNAFAAAKLTHDPGKTLQRLLEHVRQRGYGTGQAPVIPALQPLEIRVEQANGDVVDPDGLADLADGFADGVLYLVRLQIDEPCGDAGEQLFHAQVLLKALFRDSAAADVAGDADESGGAAIVVQHDAGIRLHGQHAARFRETVVFDGVLAALGDADRHLTDGALAVVRGDDVEDRRAHCAQFFNAVEPQPFRRKGVGQQNLAGEVQEDDGVRCGLDEVVVAHRRGVQRLGKPLALRRLLHAQDQECLGSSLVPPEKQPHHARKRRSVAPRVPRVGGQGPLLARQRNAARPIPRFGKGKIRDVPAAHRVRRVPVHLCERPVGELNDALFRHKAQALAGAMGSLRKHGGPGLVRSCRNERPLEFGQPAPDLGRYVPERRGAMDRVRHRWFPTSLDRTSRFDGADRSCPSIRHHSCHLTIEEHPRKGKSPIRGRPPSVRNPRRRRRGSRPGGDRRYIDVYAASWHHGQNAVRPDGARIWRGPYFSP